MSIENNIEKLDKVKLISELQEIHKSLFEVYKNLFAFKYATEEDFNSFIDKEYKESGIGSKDKKAWNDNFCHRASYTQLNKILFVRICEDKGFMLNSDDYIAGEVIDPHIGEKLSKIGLQKWKRLITNYTFGELIKFAFCDMKKSYSNIILYKEDKYEILNPKDEDYNIKYVKGDNDVKNLVFDFESVLSDIIDKLDTNNFNFKYADGNILGDVYEKFMDRETRKAIGQFYTPDFVIEYILKNTVAEADVLEKPFVTIGDVSCGSGHFLILSYDILKEKFLTNLEKLREKYEKEVYAIKKNGKEEQLLGRDYWVKENIHYHILKHCIYGADIDSFAVQLTTINLLLKDLDNFTDELNIIECDSLIKWEEDYDWQGLKDQLEEDFETVVTTQTNLFGVENEFPKIIKKENYKLKYKNISGIKTEKLINKEEVEEIISTCEFWNNEFDYIVGNPPYIGFGNKIDKQYVENRYQCFMGKSDIYIAFIELVYNKLKSQGKCGLIFPITFLNHPNNENIRDIIIRNTKIEKIVNLGEKVFEDVRKNTMIIVFKKDKNDDNYLCLTQDISKIKNFNEKVDELIENSTCKKVKQSIFEQMPLKIIDTYLDEKLIDLFLNIYKNNMKIIDIGKALDAGIDYNKKSVSDKVFYKGDIHNADDHEILSGKYINKYIKYSSDKNLIANYKDKIVNGEYIKVNEAVYELESKIIYRQTADRIIATIDDKKRYFDKSIHAIIINDKMISNKYVLCLLNSSLFKFFYDIFAGGEIRCHSDFPQVKTTFVDNLPIKVDKSKETLDLVDEVISNILKEKNNLNNLKIEDVYVNDYIEFEEKKLEVELNVLYLTIILDLIVYDIYEIPNLLRLEILNSINKDDTTIMVEGIIEAIKKENIVIDYDNYFESLKGIVNHQIKNNIAQIMELISPEKFIDEHIDDNKDIYKISEIYGINPTILKLVRREYSQKYSSNKRWKFYNLEDFFDYISNCIRNIIIVELESKMEIEELNSIKNLLESEYEEFKLLINNYKEYNQAIKTIDIVKDALNSDSYTWNAYRKDKIQDKINKTFVKYYDNNYYGLSEWSDEIHKQYFMDAIQEYTENNPNEKKAKDISKLFEDLNIEDKKDYIDVIEEKIKRAFSKEVKK